jgi:S1-C subfamily serine protease
MEHEPTRPSWLDEPPLGPPAEEPTRPFWLDDVTPASPPPPSPDDGRPVGAGDDPSARPGWLKPALVGAVVGALVAAAVAGGIVAAVDDEPSSRAASSAAADRESSRLAGEQLDVQGVLAEVGDGVVSINVSGSGGPFGNRQQGAGSGMVLDEDGHVLTNAHVVDGATSITVTLADGRELPADLVGSIPSNDVALVRLRDNEGLAPVTLGESSQLRVGDSVVAVGNALGLGATPTVTTGIVSALNREIDAENGLTLGDLIQTDAAINPGNSGGPLVNSLGEVIGVNTAIAGRAQNIGFALAIDSIKPLIEELRSGGGEVRGGAFLGVSSLDVSDVRQSVLDRFGVDVDAGAFVAEVVAGSAAEEAGLQPGDVIVGVGDDEVRSAADVGAAISGYEPGDEVEIAYVREGERRTVTVTLGSRGVQR